jgi:hypothetical protein
MFKRVIYHFGILWHHNHNALKASSDVSICHSLNKKIAFDQGIKGPYNFNTN